MLIGRILNIENSDHKVHQRFTHGELLLNRLNKIYMVIKGQLRGYMAPWDMYSGYFRDNFALLAATTVYVAVVSTAMQVGFATEPLASNAAFQSASYGFTILSILGPLIAAGIVVLGFCYIFMHNTVEALRYLRKRFPKSQV